MKKTALVLSILFCLLAITTSILPFGTIALIPIILSFVTGLIYLKTADNTSNKFAKAILLITSICLLYVGYKTYFVKNIVTKDDKFEAVKTINQNESKKELEELEELNELE
jgi:D-alanyl-lipoteichoic acid acyltransferase DltB (MBOAT superfamily)